MVAEATGGLRTGGLLMRKRLALAALVIGGLAWLIYKALGYAADAEEEWRRDYAESYDPYGR